MSLHVTRVGPAVLVQDRGRRGRAALGVTGSGPADRGAAALANRCVGNATGAAVLEVLLGGLELRTDSPLVCALTGAPAPAVVTLPDGTRLRCDGAEVLALPAGSALDLGTPSAGLRTYLAVRGGVDVPPVLGSRCRDTLSGLGPDPVRAGDVLAVGDALTGTAWSEGWCAGAGPGVPPAGAELVLDVLPGPRDDWFTPDTWERLAAGCVVGADSDRVGVRLDPARPLERAVTGELPSEGVVRGAVQVPAGGRPVVFGPDHPVTGGYPVLGVLTSASSDLLAQVVPGTRVRLRRVPAAAAGAPRP